MFELTEVVAQALVAPDVRDEGSFLTSLISGIHRVNVYKPDAAIQCASYEAVCVLR